MPVLADDLAADTFVVAWRRLDDVPQNARPWLYQVARNLSLNARRAERRRGALHAQLAGQLHGAADQGVAAEEPHLSDELRAALEGLPERDREVLLLHAWEELDAAAIATVIGCSKANATLRLHRARRRFASALEASTAAANEQELVSNSGGAFDGC